VSDPRGAPSSRNVTTTTRPELALALARSVVGPVTLCGASSATEGAPPAELDRRVPVDPECEGSLRLFWRSIARATADTATNHATPSAANLLPRVEAIRGIESPCRAA
jgi:hypothetical protein